MCGSVCSGMSLAYSRHYFLHVGILAIMCYSKKHRPTTALKLYYKTSQRKHLLAFSSGQVSRPTAVTSLFGFKVFLTLLFPENFNLLQNKNSTGSKIFTSVR